MDVKIRTRATHLKLIFGDFYARIHSPNAVATNKIPQKLEWISRWAARIESQFSLQVVANRIH